MDPIYLGRSRLLFRETCINVERLQSFQQLPWHTLAKPSVNVKSKPNHACSHKGYFCDNISPKGRMLLPL